MSILDPQNLPIPLVDQASWDLCRKVHVAPGVKRLGELPKYEVARGEINQTIYRAFITSDSEDARLLKGVEVRQYGFNDRLQQGHREWLAEAQFLAENSPRSAVHRRRIATQRITGVDEKLRIVATIVDPPCYFADSTNSILAMDDSADLLRYLLVLLNSRLIQWRFRLTSTNNNVGTNELECLPIVELGGQDRQRANTTVELAGLAENILALQAAEMASRSEEERVALIRQLNARRAQTDQLIYRPLRSY